LVYTIDYRQTRIIWGGAAGVGGTRIPLTIGPNYVLVRIAVGDRAGGARFTPDSGATGLVLFDADKWGRNTTTTRLDSVRTISGARVARRVNIDRLVIGDVQLRDQAAMILSPPLASDSSFGDGLLPLHFFTRVTFHGPERYVVFEQDRTNLRHPR
jgi:hypothetical protein